MEMLFDPTVLAGIVAAAYATVMGYKHKNFMAGTYHLGTLLQNIGELLSRVGRDKTEEKK